MQELKGNIRVFCRVRPLLADDSAAEAKVISYPTSTEFFGRGIDLMQSGKFLTKKNILFVSCYLIFVVLHKEGWIPSIRNLSRAFIIIRPKAFVHLRQSVYA